MAFKKREATAVVNAAKVRLSAVEVIDLDKEREINYGDEDRPITKVTFGAQITRCEDLTKEYNQSLERSDGLLNQVIAEEKKLAGLHKAILSSAAGKFGDDSSEYEMLGGTRRSERKKRTVKIPEP